MDTRGFYKLTDESGEYIKNTTKENVGVLFAPNFVMAPNYELLAEQKDSYTYPVDGWHYFGSEEEMMNFYGITTFATENRISALEAVIDTLLTGGTPS